MEKMGHLPSPLATPLLLMVSAVYRVCRRLEEEGGLCFLWHDIKAGLDNEI